MDVEDMKVHPYYLLGKAIFKYDLDYSIRLALVNGAKLAVLTENDVITEHDLHQKNSKEWDKLFAIEEGFKATYG